ncbi:MAG: DUF2357 domain-containing protein [Prolixibacteraceae bacterium]|nr:DUF2357 domain-containing protein [Prolixibacteraceae bacterium]
MFLEEKEIAISNNEPEWQILEGRSYEYILDESFYIEPSDIVSPSRAQRFRGRLSPNIYVGTLALDIKEEATKERCAIVSLEVRSVKAEYRTDYRQMLADITEKCTELLMQHSSPVSQTFTVDHSGDAQTLYQRFSFLRSVIESEEFDDAVHKILSSPVTQWTETEINRDVRAVRKANSKVVRQIAGGSNRLELPKEHQLFGRLHSIPRLVSVNYKKETVDTPENRFIKYALQSFSSLCEQLKLNTKASARLRNEAALLTGKLDQFLGHSVFKEISRPNTLPLNSPVLQKKEGYREILRTWLMFDLAAKLVWQGGEDVYRGGKKDIAVLYEYWLFFKLLELLKDVFQIEPKKIEDLIKPTDDGLGLQLKQGRFVAIDGVFETDTRKLNVEFSYNKSFSGNRDYPDGGSWSTTMRPDYTLSIWPNGISQNQAEIEELIVHIHFDAKYKIEKLTDVFSPEPDLDEEKIEQKKGTFKRADILKMHAYRDAIRRTAGAYVLYPGTESKNRSGFHEILPGLGAFAISPAKNNSGTGDLKKFLYDVIDHFLNRASQREKIAYKTYETFKDKPLDTVNERLPEAIKENRNFIPDDTYVLVGYCKSKEHHKWISSSGLYNARTESRRGSLKLGIGESTAKYLLLHFEGELVSNCLFRIEGDGPHIFSSEKLIDLKYPSAPNQPYYLVYKVNDKIEPELQGQSWDVSKLDQFRTGRLSGIPFSVTLSKLMSAIVK